MRAHNFILLSSVLSFPVFFLTPIDLAHVHLDQQANTSQFHNHLRRLFRSYIKSVQTGLIDMSDTTYPLTSILWPDEGFVQVFAADNTRIALLSIQFLKIGGVLTWNYIHYAVSCCINETDFELKYQGDRSESSIDFTKAPVACSLACKLKIIDRLPTFKRGPRLHYRHKGPDEATDESTMSASSRSTARQTNFRFRLAVRDGFCIVSEDEEPVAAHILPQSRPEYYEEVLGYQPGHLFEVSYGLFLESSLHRAYDRGEWGLYPDPSDPHMLVVHVFYGEKRKVWHGKKIPQSRFRVAYDSQLPDRRLLLFHYQQCIIKHIRGFSLY